MTRAALSTTSRLSAGSRGLTVALRLGVGDDRHLPAPLPRRRLDHGRLSARPEDRQFAPGRVTADHGRVGLPRVRQERDDDVAVHARVPDIRENGELLTAPSTARQRIALERRLQELPALRQALRSGRLSYEQARLVARVALPADVAARIAEAAATTCIAYRRELEGEEHRQMWRAGELRALVPDEVDALLADALRAARACSKGGLTPGEALVAVALHFVRTWKDEVGRRIRATDEVILRDGALCRIPGCSRAADHVHHLVRRSAGGPLEPWNELSLCAVHHLRGVHGGNVRITGSAPDGLAFTLGEREVAAAQA